MKKDSLLIKISEHDKLSIDEAVDFVKNPKAGGIVLFLGTVRDHNQERAVEKLEYESYPQMVEKEVEQIFTRAKNRWETKHPLRGAALIRTGSLEVGETAVILAVSASHRDEAFAACRFFLEKLKTEVPIWKKEHFSGGETWVENPPETNA